MTVTEKTMKNVYDSRHIKYSANAYNNQLSYSSFFNVKNIFNHYDDGVKSVLIYKMSLFYRCKLY